jgi:hypothetical protein
MHTVQRRRCQRGTLLYKPRGVGQAWQTRGQGQGCLGVSPHSTPPAPTCQALASPSGGWCGRGHSGGNTRHKALPCACSRLCKSPGRVAVAIMGTRVSEPDTHTAPACCTRAAPRHPLKTGYHVCRQQLGMGGGRGG